MPISHEQLLAVERAAFDLRLADFFETVEIDGARVVRYVDDEGGLVWRSIYQLLSDFGGGQFDPYHDAGDRLMDPVFRTVAAGAEAQGARVKFHLPAERPQALVVEFDRTRKALMVDEREVAAAVD